MRAGTYTFEVKPQEIRRSNIMNTTSLNFPNPIREGISKIRFAPNSDNLLISSWDSNLRYYDVGISKLRLQLPTKAVPLDFCFQSVSHVFTANSDGQIHRFDLQSGTDISIGNHDDSATCIEYSGDTSQIISSGWDRKILLWDTRLNKSLGSLNKSNLEVESISISGFNLMVAVGSAIHIYDLRQSNRSVQSEESNRNFRINCVRPIGKAEGFVVGSVDGRVALEYFDQSNPNNEGYAFRCHPRGNDKKYHHAAVNDIVFNPYIPGTFVTGDNDGYAAIWDAHSKKRLHEQSYPNSVVSLSYNHDGRLLAVASSCTYQEANEREDPIHIFVHEIDHNLLRSISASKRKKKQVVIQ